MDNLFIVNDFDWQVKRRSPFDAAVNRLLAKAGARGRISSAEWLDGVVLRLTGRRFPPTYSGQMTNVEQRMNMFHLLSQTLAYGVDGDVVELGCHEGCSAVLMAKTMLALGASRRLHVFDSFEGLPTPGDYDGKDFAEGQLPTSEDHLRKNFLDQNLAIPLIHKGWFCDTLATGLPERICFAHLDGDFYDSIKISLEEVYPRLSPGAICLVDDYADPALDPLGWNKLPGVKRACDEFLADKPEQMIFLYAASYPHAYFRKL